MSWHSIHDARHFVVVHGRGGGTSLPPLDALVLEHDGLGAYLPRVG